jgi:TRAP-type uncharacterized transport system substrate-binding protein
VVIAGGASGGAYAATAEAMPRPCATAGRRGRVLTTAGSVDNLAKIKAKQADIGIVQTGPAADFGRRACARLALLFYEPLWVFHRALGRRSEELQDIAGRRVAIGPEGSGVRALATLLLRKRG